MKNCKICGKPVSLIRYHYRDGVLCSRCHRAVPMMMKYCTEKSIRSIQYVKTLQERSDCKAFRAENSLGRMSVDTIHQLIGIKMMISSPTLVFPVSEITLPVLRLTHISQFGRWTKGTEMLSFNIRNHGFGFNIPVLLEADCPVRTEDTRDGYYTYHISEPEKVGIMRGILNQMMISSTDKMLEELNMLCKILKNAEQYQNGEQK